MGYRSSQPFERGFVFPIDPVGPVAEGSLRTGPSQGPTTTQQQQQPPVWAGPFAQQPFGGTWSTTTATPQVPTEVQGQFSRITRAAYQRHLQQIQPRAESTNTAAEGPCSDRHAQWATYEAEANEARDRADRAEQLLESVLTAEKKAVQRGDELEREVAELKKYKGEKASLSSCSIDELKLIDEALKQGRKNVKAVLQAKEKEQDARPECTVCLDKPRETVFLPCQHMACCDECGKQLKACPICRSAVKRTVFVHHC
ncbi:uncharacterized protein ACA1_052760 [Acanthamoeba castellanii str. Neff]|uniref:RING-type domain-containing protein n=1 Tax=Acanthamoeba castellanii (strain ATCC 30010 / Neff) TaxID=1257118 RepID=L8H531_ACACF|nr:uncharacterized protein ACA1_052760 [Acanthamoeba castellanii str. Neff]ELR20584.1 hypothetical protein ACA1_052760 [Acanthamoeba castellanii str. Neff]